jgi:hypothetical protein
MKELLNPIRTLEKDYHSQDPEFVSKLEFGESLLLSGDYTSATEQFNKAIELDTKNPGGWIGRAIAEICETSSEEIFSVNVDEYLNRAKSLDASENIIKYTALACGLIAFKHSSAIKSHIQLQQQALANKKVAQANAIVGGAMAVLGGAIASNSKGTFSKVVGYSLLGTGAGMGISNLLSASQFGDISNSIYKNALAHCFISIPIISYCNNILSSLPSSDFKSNMSVVINSWKDSVHYLYTTEKEQLLTRLKSLVSDDEKLNKAIIENGKIQEIREFHIFIDMIGLDNTELFKETDELDKRIEQFIAGLDSESLKEASEISPWQTGCGVFFVLAMILGASVEMGLLTEGGSVYEIIMWTGLALMIYVGVKLSRKKKRIFKDLDPVKKEVNDVIKKLESYEFLTSDVDMSALGEN